jgi:hypothetical protein
MAKSKHAKVASKDATLSPLTMDALCQALDPESLQITWTPDGSRAFVSFEVPFSVENDSAFVVGALSSVEGRPIPKPAQDLPVIAVDNRGARVFF